MRTQWYLFDVGPSTPPALEVAPGEAFTLEVRGAFADVADIRTVPTPFTPACDGHPLAPIAGPVRIRGARPGDAIVVELLEITPHGEGKTAIVRDFGVLRREFGEPCGQIRSDDVGERPLDQLLARAAEARGEGVVDVDDPSQPIEHDHQVSDEMRFVHHHEREPTLEFWEHVAERLLEIAAVGAHLRVVLVGDELGVPMDHVQVIHGDTAVVQYGIGTFGSRGTAVGSTASRRLAAPVSTS